jgi:hypothetical protein
MIGGGPEHFMLSRWDTARDRGEEARVVDHPDGGGGVEMVSGGQAVRVAEDEAIPKDAVLAAMEAFARDGSLTPVLRWVETT